MKRILLSLLYLLCVMSLRAQNKEGNQEISIGYGALTTEQMLDGTTVGILVPTVRVYTNTFASGICYLSYKGYVSKRFTLGLFAGLETQSGNWNSVDMQGDRNDWTYNKIGTFSRVAYTFAGEVSIAYVNGRNVRLFATLGLGAVGKTETANYDPAFYNSSYPGSVSTTGNWHITGYCSPFGLSVKAGDHLACNMELGFGYKGMLNLGISYRINSVTKAIPEVLATTNPADSVLLIPFDYPDDSGLVKIADIQVKRRGHTRQVDLNTQMTKLVAKATENGGNVLCPGRVYGASDNVACIKGEVYYARQYQNFKSRLDRWRKSRTDPQHAYIVIYTDKSKYGKVRLRINDHEVFIRPVSKQVVVLNNETDYKIATDKNTLTVHAVPGHRYYIKATRVRSHSVLTLVDDSYGEIESALIGSKRSARSGVNGSNGSSWADEGY